MSEYLHLLCRNRDDLLYAGRQIDLAFHNMFAVVAATRTGFGAVFASKPSHLSSLVAELCSWKG